MKAEKAFRCNNCGHVFQDEPPTQCVCTDSFEGFSPCVIVDKDWYDEMIKVRGN
jgi:rubredoxin